MGEIEPKTSNTVRALKELTSAQSEYAPQVVDLYENAFKLVNKEYKGIEQLQPGEKAETNTTVEVELEEDKYEALAFVECVEDKAFGEHEINAGLKLWRGLRERPIKSTKLYFYADGTFFVQSSRDIDHEAVGEDVTLAQSILKDLQEKIKKNEERRFNQRVRIALCGGMAILAAAAVFGMSKIEIENTEDDDFDKKGYVLTGGQSTKVGKTITPAYSEELRTNPKLAPGEVPVANFCPKYGTCSDTPVTPADGLREIWIYDNREGNNCASVDVSNATAGSRLTAWTDFRDRNGNSRADELTITLHRPSVSGDTAINACWTSQQEHEDQAPRIVFDIK